MKFWNISFYHKIYKKYNFQLLVKIFFYELKYIFLFKEFPLFDTRTNQKKEFHLSISSPFYFISALEKYLLKEKKSIFIDFGSGDGKVIRCLSQNMTCSYFFGYEIKHNLVNISKKKNKLGNVKFIQKNLSNFSSDTRIFNFIKKENIKFINIFFYNTFSLNIIIKIINCFNKIKNLRIILLGFNETDFKKLKKKINIKTKLHLNINSLYILNNDK